MESLKSGGQPQIYWNLCTAIWKHFITLHSVCEVSIEASRTRIVKQRKMRRTEQDERSMYVQHAVNRKAIPRKQGWIKLYDCDNSISNNNNNKKNNNKA
jgi:hypothetical protein